MMSNKTYDILKTIALLFPAFITFLGVVGKTLDIPYTAETITILAAFNTFLGVVVKELSRRYHKKNEGEDNEDE
jgi:hypothetical protein